jgi:hypothetical protein
MLGTQLGLRHALSSNLKQQCRQGGHVYFKDFDETPCKYTTPSIIMNFLGDRLLKDGTEVLKSLLQLVMVGTSWQ